MAKLFLPRHARTHLSGGSDPLPIDPQITYSLPGPRGIIVSVQAHPPTAELSELIDWSSGSSNAITSNDEPTGPIDGVMTTQSEPFTGLCYDVDWGTDPTFGVTIIRQGVYHIQAYWTFGIDPLPGGYPVIDPYMQAAQIFGVGNSAPIDRYVPDHVFWSDQYAGPPSIDQHHMIAVSAAEAAGGVEITLGAFTDMENWSGMQVYLEVWRLGDWEGLVES